MSNIIEIPLNEIRKFKSGILHNNLKYVIIQDKTEDYANVSLSVNIGSLDDPVEYMGLAHFLEHMLFLGSDMFPKESYFDEILKQSGGSSNAYTSAYETVYYFKILDNNLDNFYTSINIFSRFFIDPKFNESSIEREINAINSEHLKNTNNDSWFIFQVIYNLSDKDSGINRFSTGNLKTLGNDMDALRTRMKQFYNDYYCSNNMCLTIQSSHDINIVEKMIIKLFSLVPNTVAKDRGIVKLNKYKLKQIEYQIIPTNDVNEIIYFWEIPSFFSFINNNVLKVIHTIIQYNGIDNLQYVLTRKGLANSVESDSMDEGLYIIRITICKSKITLTDQIAQINTIVQYYMNIFLQSLSLEKVYEYVKNKMELNYLFNIKESNESLVNDIASNLHYYDIRNIYKGSNVIIYPDINLLKKVIQMLHFSKSNIIYISQKIIDPSMVKQFIKDKYYFKKYGKLNKSLIVSPSSSTGLNNLFSIKIDKTMLNINPVIIKNLDQYNIPTLVIKNNWYGGTSKFKEPFVFGFIYLSHERLFNTIKDITLTEIACNILNQYLSEIYADKFELGFNARLNLCTTTGIIILFVMAYNSSYTLFFNQILKDIKLIRPEQVVIHNIIEQLKENLLNINNISPWDYSTYIIGLHQNVYSYDKIKILEYIKILMKSNYINMIKKRIKRISRMYKLSVINFVYGNINRINIPIIKSTIKLTKIPIQKTLHDIIAKHPNMDEKNKIVMIIFPGGIFSPYNGAKLTILSLLLKQPTFDQLRTIHQLGYLVNSSLQLVNNNYKISIKVQSSLDINIVEQKMNDYIKWFEDYLHKLDMKEFNKIKVSVKGILLSKPSNIVELINKYTDEIKYRTFIFNRNELIVDQIDAITLETIVQLYKSLIKKKVVIKII